jgi:hypothetical protein
MNRNRVIIMTAVLLIGTVLWMPGLRSRRVAAQSPTLMGSYGFSIAVPYAGNDNGTGVIQGVFTLDGAGNATGSGGISVGVDPDPNATVPQVQPTRGNQGTYTVNPDGTGTVTLQSPNGKTTSLSFVVTDGGSQLLLVVTGGLGNAVGSGIARKQ